MEGLVILVVLAVLAVPVLMVLMLAGMASLRRRVGDLEIELARLRGAVPEPVTATREPTLAELVRTPRPEGPGDIAGAHAAADVPAQPQSPSREGSPVPPPLPPLRPAVQVQEREPIGEIPRRDRVGEFVAAVRRWFTEGNVPVKVGVLVLFAGVAALLRYASEQGMLRLPVELRLAGVAAAAVGALVFGWRQRVQRRAFGLALQGGAVGVLLLVTFAAFRLYALLPAGAAFGISVALVAGLCVLAVRQNALALAVLGVLAGFLAPIWLSTGAGNHVALFGYYAVLNAGIVAMAWRRPWRLLNLLGFAFTFGIGAAWGVLDYRPAVYASAQLFLALFFAMYLAIPLLYAMAGGPAQRRVFDGSLIFGTPLVAFALQAGLLRDERMTLAFCALGLGLLYALLAAALRRRAVFAALVAPYAVLAVGFSTLAVPLGLSARATAAIFALEGAGLVWLGLRQARLSSQVAGIALQLLAAAAFAIGFVDAAGGRAVFNAPLMTALLIAVGGFATAFAAHVHGRRALAVGGYVWALAWWLGAGLWEIDRSVAPQAVVDALMLFALGTGLLAAEAARRRPAAALHATAAAALLSPLAFAWWQAGERGQPLSGPGVLAWAAALLAGWRVLVVLRDNASRWRGHAHGGWLLSLALVLSLAALHVATRGGVGDAWRFAAAALPWMALAALALLRPERIAGPFGEEFRAWRGALASVTGTVLAGFVLAGLVREGDMAPLPYVPLLDPVELVQIAALLLAFRASEPRGDARRLLAGAAFVVATSILLRATHHWGGLPWSSSMFSTGLAQTALTVFWSVVGMAAWVAGSRGQRRGLWRAGALLMAVVLAKLVLIDRQYLGNLLGIGSFIAFGLLCTAVGYLAPVPPRAAEARA